MRRVRWITLCVGGVLLYAAAVWGQVPEKMRNIAVYSLKTGQGVMEGESELITERLRAEFFKSGLVSVTERDQMQTILTEQGLQRSGACSDDACMVEIGQLLGVQNIIAGSLGKLGSIFVLNIRSVDVRTGRISGIVSRDVRGGIENVLDVLPDAARELLTGAPPDKAALTVDSSASLQETEEKKTELKELAAPVRAAPARGSKRGIRVAYQSFGSEISHAVKGVGDRRIFLKFSGSPSVAVRDTVGTSEWALLTHPHRGIDVQMFKEFRPRWTASYGPRVLAGGQDYSSSSGLSGSEKTETVFFH